MSSDRIIWFLIISLVIISIGYIVIVYLTTRGETVEIEFNDVSCIGPLENYPDITTGINTGRFQVCYQYGGLVIDGLRFYDTQENWTVVAIDPSLIPSAQTICSGICPQTQLPTDCITRNDEYISCLNKLLPVDCSDPSVPVAHRGATFYYVAGLGKVSCYDPQI